MNIKTMTITTTTKAFTKSMPKNQKKKTTMTTTMNPPKQQNLKHPKKVQNAEDQSNPPIRVVHEAKRSIVKVIQEILITAVYS
jgi:hypothetical protein